MTTSSQERRWAGWLRTSLGSIELVKMGQKLGVIRMDGDSSGRHMLIDLVQTLAQFCGQGNDPAALEADIAVESMRFSGRISIVPRMRLNSNTASLRIPASPGPTGRATSARLEF